MTISAVGCEDINARDVRQAPEEFLWRTNRSLLVPIYNAMKLEDFLGMNSPPTGSLCASIARAHGLSRKRSGSTWNAAPKIRSVGTRLLSHWKLPTEEKWYRRTRCSGGLTLGESLTKRSPSTLIESRIHSACRSGPRAPAPVHCRGRPWCSAPRREPHQIGGAIAVGSTVDRTPDKSA